VNNPAASELPNDRHAFYPITGNLRIRAVRTPTEALQRTSQRFHVQPVRRARLSGADLPSRQQRRPSRQTLSDKLRPFAPLRRFWPPQSPTNSAAGRLRFLLHPVTEASQAETSSLLRTHPPPRTPSVRLGFPLALPYPLKLLEQKNARLPRVKRTPCERTHPQAHRGSDQESGFTLPRTLAAPAMPNQVHLRYDPLTSSSSFGLTVASDALAFRFSSPWSG